MASNRRARHDYEILDTVECGIVLQGSEVKSLRAGRIALQDSYARIVDGEMWLFGVHVPPYAQANGFGAHDPDRRRKLLAPPPPDRRVDGTDPAAVADHGAAVDLLQGRSGQGRARPGQGPRQYDKRHAIAARDAGREAAREARAAMRTRGRPDARQIGGLLVTVGAGRRCSAATVRR